VRKLSAVVGEELRPGFSPPPAGGRSRSEASVALWNRSLRSVALRNGLRQVRKITHHSKSCQVTPSHSPTSFKCIPIHSYCGGATQVLISEGMPLDAKAARPKKRAAGGSLAEAEAAEDDDMV
jgi:hypothetical protein